MVIVLAYAESRCFTAFIDILGISDLIERNLEIARDKLSLFHDHVRKFIAMSPEGLKQTVAFSDCVVLVWSDLDKAIDGCTKLFNLVFDANGALFERYYADHYKYRAILLRGAISEGSLELEDEEVNTGSIQKFIFGSALSRSAKGEGLLKGSRLTILGDIHHENTYLEELTINPRGKQVREIHWPMLRTDQRFSEKIKWIMSLCDLYSKDNQNVCKHYRDTLWVFARSLDKLNDDNLVIDFISLLEQHPNINLKTPYWSPISLCVADILIKKPRLKTYFEDADNFIHTAMIMSSLKLMENIE
ncbi:hypothetical protein D3C76_436810 [compost metagenome]